MPSFEEIPDLGWEPEVLEAKAKGINEMPWSALS
jgi:hypothetical protein